MAKLTGRTVRGFGETKNKMKGKTFITMKGGSRLYLVESENVCTIRMIRKLVEDDRISSDDFRHYVRCMFTS